MPVGAHKNGGRTDCHCYQAGHDPAEELLHSHCLLGNMDQDGGLVLAGMLMWTVWELCLSWMAGQAGTAEEACRAGFMGESVSVYLYVVSECAQLNTSLLPYSL